MVIQNLFLTIPVELEEAARIDGCGYTQTFFKIMLPIARPGILTAAMLAFMNYWNEYYWASMVLTTKELKTVPAILAQFQNAFFYELQRNVFRNRCNSASAGDLVLLFQQVLY